MVCHILVLLQSSFYETDLQCRCTQPDQNKALNLGLRRVMTYETDVPVIYLTTPAGSHESNPGARTSKIKIFLCSDRIAQSLPHV